MPAEYIVKTKRTHAALGMGIGAVLLWLGLDLHFLCVLHGWKVSPDGPVWILFALAGIGLIVATARTFVSPRTLLRADAQGITLYSWGSSHTWNAKTKSWDTTRRRGDTVLIPWANVREIQAGEIYTGTQTVKGTGVSVPIAGGTATIGARQRVSKAKALQVLCDASVKLDGYGAERFIDAWNGFEEADLKQMSRAERQSLDPKYLSSGFALNRTYLKDALPQAITIMETMRQQFAVSPPGNRPA